MIEEFEVKLFCQIWRIFEYFEVFIKRRVSLAEEKFLEIAVLRMVDNAIGSHLFCQFTRKIPSVNVFVRFQGVIYDFFQCFNRLIFIILVLIYLIKMLTHPLREKRKLFRIL